MEVTPLWFMVLGVNFKLVLNQSVRKNLLSNNYLRFSFHKTTIILKVGTYTYKFFVDGEWKHDLNKKTVPNSLGGVNNEVIFIIKNS